MGRSPIQGVLPKRLKGFTPSELILNRNRPETVIRQIMLYIIVFFFSCILLQIFAVTKIFQMKVVGVNDTSILTLHQVPFMISLFFFSEKNG